MNLVHIICTYGDDLQQFCDTQESHDLFQLCTAFKIGGNNVSYTGINNIAIIFRCLIRKEEFAATYALNMCRFCLNAVRNTQNNGVLRFQTCFIPL